MTDKLPSDQQRAASKAQSKADQHAGSKAEASAMQSEADRAAVPKHGL